MAPPVTTAGDCFSPRWADFGLFSFFGGRRFRTVGFAVVRRACRVFCSGFCFCRRPFAGAGANGDFSSTTLRRCSRTCSDAVDGPGSGADTPSSGPHWNSSCPGKALRRSPVCSSTFSCSCLLIDSKTTDTVCVQHVRGWQQTLGLNLLFGYQSVRGVTSLGVHFMRE